MKAMESEHRMRSPFKLLARFLREESGATAIEYGLIAFAIFFAILTAVQLIGACSTARVRMPSARSSPISSAW